MRYETAQVTRLGNREVNQDRFATSRRGDHVLLVVADGMGGHERGELAAQELVVHVTAAFQRASLPIDDPPQFLRRVLAEAHEAIVALGQRHDPPIYPRTTAVVALVQGSSAWWAHIGDSRAYWVHGAALRERSRDHTYVEDLLRHEAISEEEVASHPLRNIVTYCLGGPESPPPATVSEEARLQAGDILLLCSDGLWGALSEAELVRGLEGEELQQGLGRLAGRAEAGEAPFSDNVTAVPLRVLAPDEDLTGAARGEGREEAAAGAGGPDGGPSLAEAVQHLRAMLVRYGGT